MATILLPRRGVGSSALLGRKRRTVSQQLVYVFVLYRSAMVVKDEIGSYPTPGVIGSQPSCVGRGHTSSVQPGSTAVSLHPGQHRIDRLVQIDHIIFNCAI